MLSYNIDMGIKTSIELVDMDMLPNDNFEFLYMVGETKYSLLWMEGILTQSWVYLLLDDAICCMVIFGCVDIYSLAFSLYDHQTWSCISGLSSDPASYRMGVFLSCVVLWNSSGIMSYKKLIHYFA